MALQQNARKYKNVWNRRRKPPLTIPMVEVVISSGSVVKSETGCVLEEEREDGQKNLGRAKMFHLAARSQAKSARGRCYIDNRY
ncbi:hypothetical protein KC325_g243 [Hortaea werneckii]|nr:hypothetical protein KC325_g243 [Hortaea werneckii]